MVLVTVTAQDAVLVVSLCGVAVMVAVPVPTAVTVQPLVVGVVGLTEATLVLLLLQMTFLFVALSGLTVATRSSVTSTAMVVADLFNVTPVTATGALVTVTVQDAVLVVSLSEVTVILAVPAATPVTTPPVTVATALLLLLQVTFLSVAVDGATVATRVFSLPLPVRRLSVNLSKVTPVTGSVTVTVHVAFSPLSCVTAIMVAVPAVIPDPPVVIVAVSPLPKTVATFVLVLLQLTLWSVA